VGQRDLTVSLMKPTFVELERWRNRKLQYNIAPDSASLYSRAVGIRRIIMTIGELLPNTQAS
jgi:hypothetical protein